MYTIPYFLYKFLWGTPTQSPPSRAASACINHTERIIDCILKGVARIGIPWWCDRQNQQRLRERKDTRAENTKLKKTAHK
jgi:hypothetical protein